MAIIYFQPHNKIDLLKFPNKTFLKIYNYPSTYHHFNTRVFNCLQYQTLIKHNFYIGNDNESGLSLEFQCDDQNRFRILYGYRYDIVLLVLFGSNYMFYILGVNEANLMFLPNIIKLHRYDKFMKMKLPYDFYEGLNEYSFSHHNLIDQGYRSYDVLFGHCKEYYPNNHNESYISNSIGLDLHFNHDIQGLKLPNNITSKSTNIAASTPKSTKLLPPPPPYTLVPCQQKPSQLIDYNSFKFNKLDEGIFLDPFNDIYHPQFPTCEVIALHNEKLNNAFTISSKPTTKTTTTTTTTTTTLQ